jgi:hypothetical protein
MREIFDPDTPGGLVFCIACRADSRSVTTDDMVNEISGDDPKQLLEIQNLMDGRGCDVKNIVPYGLWR